MHLILKGDDRKPARGSWYLHGEPPLAVICIRCSFCGKPSTLRHMNGSGHQIAADGAVNPSVVCPHSGCNFHEWCRLEGWTGSELPPAE